MSEARPTEIQSIPVVKDDDANVVTSIIVMLDAAVALARFNPTTVLFADEGGLVEYAFRLWASAHQHELKDVTHTYEEGHSIRSLEVSMAPALWLRVQWPSALAPACEQHAHDREDDERAEAEAHHNDNSIDDRLNAPSISIF